MVSFSTLKYLVPAGTGIRLSQRDADALIAAVGECRVSAISYGKAMAQLLPAGVMTQVRWSRYLQLPP